MNEHFADLSTPCSDAITKFLPNEHPTTGTATEATTFPATTNTETPTTAGEEIPTTTGSEAPSTTTPSVVVTSDVATSVAAAVDMVVQDEVAPTNTPATKCGGSTGGSTVTVPAGAQDAVSLAFQAVDESQNGGPAPGKRFPKAAIIGGSVAGGLVVIALLAVAVRRYRARKAATGRVPLLVAANPAENVDTAFYNPISNGPATGSPVDSKIPVVVTGTPVDMA